MTRVTLEHLAHDARIASLEAKIAKLTERIDALTPKPRKVERLPREVASAHAAMASVCREVAIKHQIRTDRLRSHDGRQVFSGPRFEAWALCRDMGFSLSVIGEYFGRRDHTTILAGIRKHRQCETPAK